MARFQLRPPAPSPQFDNTARDLLTIIMLREGLFGPTLEAIHHMGDGSKHPVGECAGICTLM